MSERKALPPPERGNSRALTHGAYSSRLVNGAATELEQSLYELAPYLSELDGLAVRRFAISEAIVGRLSAWILKNGVFDSKGRVRPAVRELQTWLNRSERAGIRLGLDPVARAALQNDVAHTASTLHELREKDLAEGRRLREEAEQRTISVEPRAIESSDAEHEE